MEELSVKEVVQENKRNAEAFGVFMSGRIVLPDGRPGQLLSQFLAEERLQGRYPLLGRESSPYKPLKWDAIIVAPREWGATIPDELVGALVGVSVVGNIPISSGGHMTGEIRIIRLTEPDGTTPTEFVRADLSSEVETDIQLGWDTWVDYPPGIPTAFPPEEPESDHTPDDDEGYW